MMVESPLPGPKIAAAGRELLLSGLRELPEPDALSAGSEESTSSSSMSSPRFSSPRSPRSPCSPRTSPRAPWSSQRPATSALLSGPSTSPLLSPASPERSPLRCPLRSPRSERCPGSAKRSNHGLAPNLEALRRHEDELLSEMADATAPMAPSGSPLGLSRAARFSPVSNWVQLCAMDGDGAILRTVISFFIASTPESCVAGKYGEPGAPAVELSAGKDLVMRHDLLNASAACRYFAAAADTVFASLLLPPAKFALHGGVPAGGLAAGSITCRPLAPAMAPPAHDAAGLAAAAATAITRAAESEDDEGAVAAAEAAVARAAKASTRVPLLELPAYASLSAPSARPGLATFVALPERRVRAFTACDNVGRSALDELYGNPVFCVRYRGIRQGSTVFPASGAPGPVNPHMAAATTGCWPLQLNTYFKMRTYTKFERLMGVYAGRSHLPLPWLAFHVTDRLYGVPPHLCDSHAAAEAAARAARRAARGGSVATNNGRFPLLPYGSQIMSKHSLWTVGIEPGDGGLDEEEAALSNGSAEGALGSAQADEEEAADAEAAAAAAAAPAAAAALAAAHDRGVDENSADDVWVDSYLCCKEDEVFICVRDRRSVAEEPNPRALRLSRMGAVDGEGALMGDGTDFGGSGYCGRFAAGDQGSDLPSVTNDADPGQPVRPPHRGWLFKVKAGAPLGPLLARIRAELRPEGPDAPSPESSATSLAALAAALPGAETHPPDFPAPFAEIPAAGGLPKVKASLLHFVAVAPQFGAGRASAPVRPLDTPLEASMRAAFGPSNGAVRPPPCPLHILEVHDLSSYIALVWNK